ncbi:MAG: DUF1016 N-terminal domain-containing protein [Myxococcota bacterium]
MWSRSLKGRAHAWCALSTARCGEARAEYGEEVIEDLSHQLLARVGQGYSTRNLWYFRDFYLTYRGRSAEIRTDEFRTSLVQNSKRRDTAKFLHEAGAEFAQGFSSRC